MPPPGVSISRGNEPRGRGVRSFSNRRGTAPKPASREFQMPIRAAYRFDKPPPTCATLTLLLQHNVAPGSVNIPGQRTPRPRGSFFFEPKGHRSEARLARIPDAYPRRQPI